MMEELMRKFIKYATFNDEGDITGIKNAPEEATEAFREFVAIQEDARKKGVKI